MRQIIEGISLGHPWIWFVCTLVHIWTTMLPTCGGCHTPPCRFLSIFCYFMKMWRGMPLGTRVHFMWGSLRWQRRREEGRLLMFYWGERRWFSSLERCCFLVTGQSNYWKILDVLPLEFLCVGEVPKIRKASGSWCELIDFAFAPNSFLVVW